MSVADKSTERSPPVAISKSLQQQKKTYGVNQNVFLSDNEMKELLKNHTKEQIVSAFANSTKAIQDKFTEQIADYQRLLEEKNPKQQIKRKDIDWER